MYSKEELDFAYKYPFSDEAREVIKEINLREIEQRHLIIGKARIDEALQNDKIEYRESDYGKLDFVVGYVYARMLISSLKSPVLVIKYANAEAKRASDALARDSDSNLIKLSRELGLEIREEGEKFAINFAQFLANAQNIEGFSLSNHKLSRGVVVLDRYQTIKVMGSAVVKAVAKGLPIKSSDIPRVVLEYAKGIKVPVPKMQIRKGAGNIGWIDRLLQTPIPDARHRTVNLILAPYLVNIKGLPVEKAIETISNYIALCKSVNPDTKITDRYIKYQCEYAKSHGMRPLSLARARVELGGGIDFVAVLGEEDADKGKVNR